MKQYDEIRRSAADAARRICMNISTFSPALALLYVFALLWILMGVDAKSFSRTQRWIVPLAVVVLCAVNHLLRNLLGPVTYGNLLLFCMHMPTFVLFLYIAKRGVVKTAFMILTALVFTAPVVLIGNLVRRLLFAGSPTALLLSNLISYLLLLLLAQFVFRSGFNYLLIYGDNRLFLLFSLVPLVYYIYVFAAINMDVTNLPVTVGYVVRFFPTIEVFLFYFLFPYIYKSLREKQEAKAEQDALLQKLASTENQIELLNESNLKMAVYRHDVRHQLILLDGLLSSGNIEQAQEFVKTAMADLDALAPKKFCENETVNLLCSSYDSKARRLGVRLAITAILPKTLPLSDTELCSVVSNGLENALRAAAQPELFDKWVEFYCETKQNKLLIQIKNPYAGQITMQDGLPVSAKRGHGYGCRSIQAIAQRNGGLCSFKAENGLFTLRMAFPLPAN